MFRLGFNAQICIETLSNKGALVSITSQILMLPVNECKVKADFMLIWLELRRSFPVEHKEGIILLLFLLLLLLLLFCAVLLYRHMWRQRWKWNTEKEIYQTGNEQHGLSDLRIILKKQLFCHSQGFLVLIFTQKDGDKELLWTTNFFFLFFILL